MAIVTTDDKHYTAIAEEIRRHVSSVGTLTPEQMPDAISTACDAEFSMGYYDGEQAGRQNQHEEFWDSYLTSGIPGHYMYRFAGHGWNDTTFKPTEDLIPTSDCAGMFNTSSIVNLTKCLEDQGVRLDLSQCTKRVDLMFAYSIMLEDIPVLDVRNAKRGTDNTSLLNSMFSSCTALRIIRGIYINDEGNADFKSAFDGCKNLEEVYFYGILGRNGLNLQWSTKLTHDSLMSVINCLADKSGDTSTEWAVTIGDTNKAKLTEEELKIATDKNWVVK